MVATELTKWMNDFTFFDQVNNENHQNFFPQHRGDYFTLRYANFLYFKIMWDPETRTHGIDLFVEWDDFMQELVRIQHMCLEF